MHIDPSHVTLVRSFGFALSVGGILSLTSGKTYYRRVILKVEEPMMYWLNTIFLLGFGSFLVIASFTAR